LQDGPPSIYSAAKGVTMPTRLSPALRKEFLNLPNVLTYLRIASIPFIVFVLRISDEAITESEIASRWLCFATFLLFGAAAITDYLDGWLARKYNQTTLVGKFIDPIADKLIVLATLVTLVELGRVPSWIVVLILLREIAINGLRTLAMAEGLVIDVVQAGKIKTALQLMGIQGLILYYSYPTFVIDWEIPFGFLGELLLILSLVFSFISAWVYFRGFVREIVKKYENKEVK